MQLAPVLWMNVGAEYYICMYYVFNIEAEQTSVLYLLYILWNVSNPLLNLYEEFSHF